MSEERKIIIVDVEKEAISVEAHEKTVPLTATLLTSVEYVFVSPPPDRPDGFCCIYGDISVTDDLNKPAVTLFSRPRDDPQIINFRDSHFCYLDLTHHGSDRALSGDSDNYVTFHLYEKKNVLVYEDTDGEEEEEEDPDGGEDQRGSDSEEEEDPDGEEDERGSDSEKDEVIADIKEVEFRGLYDSTSSFELKGNPGFGFKLSHAAVFRVRVRVEVKINRAIELIGAGIVKSICGRIAAWQYLGDPFQDALIRLYSASRYEPTLVRVGEPIPLDRHIVVAPLADGWLSIGLALWSGNTNKREATDELVHKTQIADELVHFGILPIFDRPRRTFLTNEQRTHTKQVLDGLFSVSITFVD